jgi:hypothetical protein
MTSPRRKIWHGNKQARGRLPRLRERRWPSLSPGADCAVPRIPPRPNLVPQPAPGGINPPCGAGEEEDRQERRRRAQTGELCGVYRAPSFTVVFFHVLTLAAAGHKISWGIIQGIPVLVVNNRPFPQRVSQFLFFHPPVNRFTAVIEDAITAFVDMCSSCPRPAESPCHNFTPPHILLLPVLFLFRLFQREKHRLNKNL